MGNPALLPAATVAPTPRKQARNRERTLRSSHSPSAWIKPGLKAAGRRQAPAAKPLDKHAQGAGEREEPFRAPQRVPGGSPENRDRAGSRGSSRAVTEGGEDLCSVLPGNLLMTVIHQQFPGLEPGISPACQGCPGQIQLWETHEQTSPTLFHRWGPPDQTRPRGLQRGWMDTPR